MPRPKNDTPLQKNMRRKITEINQQLAARKEVGGLSASQVARLERERSSYQGTLNRSVQAVAAARQRARSRRLAGK